MTSDRTQTHADWLSDFHRYVCPTSSTPIGICVDWAEGCRIGAQGVTYLDFLSGIGVTNVGHRHPDVVAAIHRQVERYLHVMVYGEFVQESQVALARALAQILPGQLDMTYFTNSGAEAVEGALKLARKVTGRPGIIAFTDGYHGDTLGALSAGGSAVHRASFEPLLPGVRFLPFGDQAALDAIHSDVGAVIVEPVQAEAGVRIPPQGFLTALREACTAAGALLIFDEVQVGIGRTGRWFACEHWGVVPDVLVMAKGLGGGMPLGAFSGTPELMRALSVDPPLSHLTTFGGHPVSAAAGAAALAVIQREGLLHGAGQWGAWLVEHVKSELGLPAWGLGLMIGIDCGSAAAARALIRAALDRHLIIGDCLHAPSVVKLCPPLIVGKLECEEAMAILSDAWKHVKAQGQST